MTRQELGTFEEDPRSQAGADALALLEAQMSITENTKTKKPDIHQKINARINGHHEKPSAARRGSGKGFNSPEAKAKRKGMHDVHSGRLSPEAIALMPTNEVYEAAWRTRGELSPAEKMNQEMQAGEEYSPSEH